MRKKGQSGKGGREKRRCREEKKGMTRSLVHEIGTNARL